MNKIYIEKIDNNKLGAWTSDFHISKKLGWNIIKDENEIEKSEIDNCWYLKGFAPKFTEEEKISKLRSQKKTEAENALTFKIAEITPHYPTDEKVSFAKQEEEALKYVANPDISESEIPCIAGIAKGRQMVLSELVQKILIKASLFASLSGYYMGLKQRIEDLADKAQTEEEINAIDVQAIFGEPMQPVEPEPETNSESETSPEATE